MTEIECRDFNIDGIACRWQLQPADTFGCARDWLRDGTTDAIADGLQRDARGRPRLPAGMGDISWSHAGNRLLLACAPSGTIGVDVERVDRRMHALRIARRYFAAEEIAALEALDDAARSVAFLRLWCAKEAVLKAHGHGIAFGLGRVAFAFDAEQIRITQCDPALGDIGDWRLHHISPEPGYLAMLAWHDGILRA